MGKSKMVPVLIELYQEELDDLRILAKADGRLRKPHIEWLLRQYIKNNKDKKPFITDPDQLPKSDAGDFIYLVAPTITNKPQ